MKKQITQPVSQRTSTKTLDWKSSHVSLHRALKKSYSFEIDHLKIFECKTYSLLKNNDVSSKSEKLTLKAFVDYLIEYDSTNIFRVWNSEIWSVSNYRDIIFDKDEIFFINVKKDLILEKKIVEFVKLKVFDSVLYIVNLTENDEKWLTTSIRNRTSIKNSTASKMLVASIAKDVFKISISRQSFSNSEITSLFQVVLTNLSSSTSRDNRTARDSLSTISDDLSEID